MARVHATERDEARDRLRKWLPRGATAWTVLRHVSPSGMSRSISVLSLDVQTRCAECDGPMMRGPEYGSTYHAVTCAHNGKPDAEVPAVRVVDPGWLSHNVHLAIGWPEDRPREAVRVAGVGQDAGVHLVETLARALYDDPRALKQRWL